MGKPSDSAYGFEGVKVFLRQDKNGYTMGVSIHPNDVPEALMRDLVGQRYIFAMVPLNHDDTPRITASVVENPPVDPYLEICATMPERGEDAGDDPTQAVKRAGILCRDPLFHDWIGVTSEQEAVNFLHRVLLVDSRTDLKTDEKARRRLDEITSDYSLWKNSQPLVR